MNRARFQAATLVVAAFAVGASASLAADSADPPVTLRLGTAQYQGGASDSAVMRHFADKVQELSDGNVTIELVYQAGEDATDYEARVVELVQNGDLELGWIASRAVDGLGVTAFQALQAPFLITDYDLYRKVMSSSLPQEMLEGLDSLNVIGLGVYPDKMRHPAGIDRPLVTLADFQGARIRVPTSNASDALWRAFGSDPLHLNGVALAQALASHLVDGVDTTMDGPVAFGDRFVTGNVTLYPIADLLFLSHAASAALSDRQLAVLHSAAEETRIFALTDLPLVDSGARYCDSGGSVVNAGASDLEQIVAAAAPVTAALEVDPQTRSFIEQIRALKAETPAVPTAPSCGDAPSASAVPTGVPQDPFPAGTYTAVATRQDALRNGVDDGCAVHQGALSLRLVIGNGTYLLFGSCDSHPEENYDGGTYTSTPETVDMGPGCCPGRSTVYSWTLVDGVLILAVIDESNSPPGDITHNHFLYEHDWLIQGG